MTILGWPFIHLNWGVLWYSFDVILANKKAYNLSPLVFKYKCRKHSYVISGEKYLMDQKSTWGQNKMCYTLYRELSKSVSAQLSHWNWEMCCTSIDNLSPMFYFSFDYLHPHRQLARLYSFLPLALTMAAKSSVVLINQMPKSRFLDLLTL